MILVIDDDPSVGHSLALLLKQHGRRARTAAGPDEALALVAAQRFDLALCDMNFSGDTGGREGLELLARLRAAAPALPVILITAWGSIELAVEGMKAGATDFITKPWNNDVLVRSVETALSLAAAKGAADTACPTRAQLDAKHDFGALVGDDPQFLRALDLVARVAPTDAAVLITGESGTGKELIAEAIHRNSRRAAQPFVRVNVGGISSTLFESEMFGHVRGAFTDARADRKGRFETAHRGTIFLDEIGEMDPSTQVKLLRVLQDRTFEVLGTSTPRMVDIRVVSATNRELGTLVKDGQFREDLLYRLNLITVHLPALRERAGDVGVLAAHFLAGFSRAYGRTLSFSPRALRWLETQPWPGNVRQLRHTIERAVLVLDGDTVDAPDLERLARQEPGGGAPPLPPVGSMTLDEMERAMIERTLAEFEGNLSRTADALGLSRAALYRRLRKYGLSA